MKTIRHTYLTLFAGTLCFLALTFPAWGAEGTDSVGPGAGQETSDSVTSGSAVLVCGGESSYTKSEYLTLSGPGASDSGSSAADSTDSTAETGTRGESLGMFTTTGYCTCTQCCAGGWALTYSGTVPKAKHTISADISLYPIGTKLMIDDVIYTVEDVGSSVLGSWIDIYYDNHEDAVGHGMKQQEVFTVIP